MFRDKLQKDSVIYIYQGGKVFNNNTEILMFIAGEKVAVRFDGGVSLGVINYNYEINSRSMKDGKATGYYTGTKKELRKMNEEEFMLDQGSVRATGAPMGYTNYFTSKAGTKRVLWKIHKVFADMNGVSVSSGLPFTTAVYVPIQDQPLFQIVNSGWPKDTEVSEKSKIEQVKERAGDAWKATEKNFSDGVESFNKGLRDLSPSSQNPLRILDEVKSNKWK